MQLTKLKTELNDDGVVSCYLHIDYEGKAMQFTSDGNGPIDASKKALSTLFPNITIESYSEHSLSEGSDSKAICYLTVLFGDDVFHGVGIDTNITLASVKALISAINRKIKGQT